MKYGAERSEMRYKGNTDDRRILPVEGFLLPTNKSDADGRVMGNFWGQTCKSTRF
jgi:hypothetical protein